MNYNIETIPYFDKQAKKLGKKHKSLKQDLKAFFESLERNPTQGIKLTENTYKIRIAIKSKGKGKSAGNYSHQSYKRNYLSTFYL